ncbi:outer membrane beta-barrel protein [Ohtaekwangia kribbensis]|jgi:hypothetical protein|uniref:Outer membrane beta-barrel protein n=1 Tax=Ohtaekwangia kribbensis TaxID=688913 RepID=A0ABW3JZW7_9BACT
MRNTLLLFFILTSLAVNAQVKRIVLKAGANRPFINDVTNTFTMVSVIPSPLGYGNAITVATFNERYDEKIGADLAGSIDYTIWRKFFVSTGLGVNYTRFKRDGAVVGLDDFANGNLGFYSSTYPIKTGVPIGSIYGPTVDPRFTVSQGKLDNLGKTDLVYVQIPLMAGISLLQDKLMVRAGTTLSTLVYASEYESRYSASDNVFYEQRSTSKEKYNQLLAGITLNATYYIMPGLGIDVSANKSLTPIYDLDDDGTEKAKMTLLSLGLCYSIVK